MGNKEQLWQHLNEEHNIQLTDGQLNDIFAVMLAEDYAPYTTLKNKAE